MAEPTAAGDEVAFTLDGRELTAAPGELVIDAAERHGVYIPRFCYHSRLEPVGMCRMCIVDVDTGRGPALQPSCMLAVTDGMVVDTGSEGVQKAQDGVLEFLLANHPLDCPVCDKGGECPLQDQTVAYGPGESRFVEEKRHYAKPIAISENVALDRERCILCDRCTRFAADVAGDPLIAFMDRGASMQVNTFPDEPFASYFSGNTVQICPVGALTATPYRFRARPWDLQQDESTCTGCSVGCRIAVQTARNQVLRYQGVDVDPVNWGWLCDKGRFGFEAVGHDARLGDPQVRGSDGALAPTRWADALDRVADALRGTPPKRIGVIGGARLTNEDAYAWSKLAKGVLGTDNVDAQLDDGLPAPVALGLPRATIDEVCAPGGTVLLLAPDLKEELPVLHLRLRHAVVRDGVRVIELSSVRTGLTAHAAASLRHRPGEAADVVDALAADDRSRAEELGIDADDFAVAVAALGDGPIRLVVGRPSLAESGARVAHAAVRAVDAFSDVTVLPVLRRANVHGALDMGLAPGLLPGRVDLEAGRAWYGERWPGVPERPGMDTAAMLRAAADGGLDVLVLLGADPLVDAPDRDLAARALDATGTVVALDLFTTASVAAADVVLPVAGFAECDGTTTNVEGRVSVVTRRVTAPGSARSDWTVAAELAGALEADLGLESVAQIQDEIATVVPGHAGLAAAAQGDGVVVPTGPLGDAPPPVDGRAPFDVPALPAPDAYSLRLVCPRPLYDAGTLVAHAPSLAGLAAPAALRLHPHDFAKLGVADGAEVRVTSARGSVVLAARRDAGVARGAAAVAFNQPGVTGAELISVDDPVTDVRVETV